MKLRIDLSPIRSDLRLALSRAGESLVVNGVRFDLPDLPDGGSLAAEELGLDFLLGEIRREGDDLRLTLLLPHGPEAGPDTLFPASVLVADDGPVALPPWGPEAP
jgi:hypothetical protein